MKFEIVGDVLKRCQLEEGETTVVVPEGVTEIGEGAFSWCSNLKSVVIPASVTKIGKDAFSSCGMESIVIPESVTEIGESAFSLCFNLKSVVIPASVTKIGKYAFHNCGLESIVIPEGVTEIGETAFAWCVNLKSVVIPESLTEIGESIFWDCNKLDRMILSADGSVLIRCPPALAVGDVVVPESVRRIGGGAFGRCEKLTQITLHENVNTVGSAAFYKCLNLKKVHIASPSTHIEPGAFAKCKSLEHMILGDNETALIYCPPAFANRHLRLPETVTYIGSGAFASCPLKRVTLPPSVKNAPANAFVGCREITVYDSIDADRGDCYAYFESNGAGEWSGSQIGFMSIENKSDPLNCTIIVRSAVTGEIRHVVEMELDSGNLDYRCLLLYGWGKNATFAFRELDRMFPAIKSTTHKRHVALLRLQYGVDMDDKTRDYYRKYVSRSAKDILRMCMEEGRMDWVKVCEEAGVLRKDVVEYAIAQAAEAKKAEFAAFFLEYQRTHFPPKEEKCDDRLRLPDLPKEKKEKKPLDKNSKGYIKKVWKCEELEDGTLCLLRYYGEDTEVTVPDSIDGKRISTIGSRAFSPNQGHITDAQKEIRKNITSVSLGSGIREIGKEAFCVCEKLGKVCFAAPEPALETGEAPGEIGAERSRVAIGEYAFWRCKSLTSVIGSENIASLEKGAFVSCSELKDIRLAPETRVAELAFWGCASLDMVICGDGGKTLLFCSPSCAVGNVVLPEGIERIGGYAFEDCKQLTGIQLPASLKYINDYAFRCCERLERIIFCGKPESVAEHAFEWDNALKTLESPHDLKKIECLTVALKKSFVRWHVRLIQRDVSDFSKGAAPLPNMVVVG